jgi:DNA adenine methylase
VIRLLPLHGCYVEPFAGAAWVLLGKQPSAVEVLNDADQELINFFMVVREQPLALVARFDYELVSRARFDALLATSPETLDPVARAHRFFYILMASWGGDRGHGNRLIGALKTLEKRVRPVHSRLRTVLIEAGDWRECVERYDRPYADHGVVMYFDPPYPENTCHYARNMRSWDEHEELVAVLRGLQARFVLSSYDTPEVRALCDGLYFTDVEFAAGMPSTAAHTSRTRNRELLITNFPPKVTGPARPRRVPRAAAMRGDGPTGLESYASL